LPYLTHHFVWMFAIDACTQHYEIVAVSDPLR
jgi:hypothetical protein